MSLVRAIGTFVPLVHSVVSQSKLDKQDGFGSQHLVGAAAVIEESADTLLPEIR